MFSKRSTQTEKLDDPTINHVDLLKNLHEIEMTNRWFGSQLTLISGLSRIYSARKGQFRTNTLQLVDLGCGNGDLLRAMDSWSRSKKIKLKLHGLDVNKFIVEQAEMLSSHYPQISYQAMDITAKEFKTVSMDIATLNSFCHHLSDEQLVSLFQQLRLQTKLAILINDLHRHWLPYIGIKLISRLLNFSAPAKNDGPISVLRSFSKKDLINLMKLSKIENFHLRWSWVFRWQLIIWCN